MDKLEQIKNAVTANGMRGWTDERVGQAMLDYSDQQNAELLAKITHLEKSYAKFAKERDEQYGEYIDLNVSLRNENAELRERVKELETALMPIANTHDVAIEIDPKGIAYKMRNAAENGLKRS